MPIEAALVPYRAARVIPARTVLVVAPHPDDEVFGCGGAILAHLHAGAAVHVLVLTDGGAGGDPARRVEESRHAARTLGCGEPEFWGLPDRGLYATAELERRLAARIAQIGADLVYAPSVFEVHPDHRQAHALLRRALHRLDPALRVCFYEVGMPLVPNLLLDITAWVERKRAAIACFASQLAGQDYQQQIEGLNRFRSYTLGRDVQAAEAFCLVDAAALLRADPSSTSPADAFTWQRLQDPGAVPGPADRPLVSVVVRSFGRPLLHEALDSVARQTWPAVEVVVVAAAADHSPLPERCGPYPLRQVGTGGALARCRAANVGMAHAQGEYLLLLDDDDWLLPSHLERLVGALRGQTLWRAACTGVLLVDRDNHPTGQTLDQPFDPVRQRTGTRTPIQALLFHRSLLAEGCRFDEGLDRHQDWDFWLQVSARTVVAQLPGVSAACRTPDQSRRPATRRERLRELWRSLRKPK